MGTQGSDYSWGSHPKPSTINPKFVGFPVAGPHEGPLSSQEEAFSESAMHRRILKAAIGDPSFKLVGLGFKVTPLHATL